MDLSFLPAVINDEPTPEMLKGLAKIKIMRVALKVSGNIYWRCRLAEAQNWRCCWCGIDCVPESDLHNSATIEHVVPRSVDPSIAEDPDNWAMACSRCNNRRGTLSIEDFMSGKPMRDAQPVSKKKKAKGQRGRGTEAYVKIKIKKGLRLKAQGWVAADGTQLTPEMWLATIKVFDDIRQQIYDGVMTNGETE